MKSKLELLWWLLSIIFPIAVTWMPFFIINSNRSHPLSLLDELSSLILQSIFVSAPFVILAIWSRKKLISEEPNTRKAAILSGVIVLILYSLFVSWLLFDSFTRRSGGANLGGGLLLMVSTFILSGVMIIAYQIFKRR